LLDKIAGFPNEFGCSPELVQSLSPVSRSLAAPCTDACPDPDVAAALPPLHSDREEADDRPEPTDRTVTLARWSSQAFRFALSRPLSAPDVSSTIDISPSAVLV
jgi:hypothetical protein